MLLARFWAVMGCLLLTSGAVQARPDDRGYQRGYEDVFRCESKDRRQSYCRADVRGQVVLVDQISKNPCIEGSTWGTDGRGVWVSEGCRGDFAIVQGRRGRDPGYDRGLPDPYPSNGNRGRGSAQTIRCESRDRGYRHCDARVRGSAEIQRQLSDARCDYGRTWGYDKRGVWVDGGCRADFVIYD